MPMDHVHAADDTEVRALYRRLLDGWNKRDASAMAAPFDEAGEMIGFDGSQVVGREAMVSHLEPIFADHPTAAYVAKVREVRFPTPEVAILRAIVGMVPPGKADIEPRVNAHQTVVASKRGGGDWRILLFQNTPAQFHGRPDLVEQMTAELRDLLPPERETRP